MPKITLPSPNAKRVPIGLYVKPAVFRREHLGSMCNAEEAVAMSKHRTSIFRINLWVVVILISLLAYGVHKYPDSLQVLNHDRANTSN